MTQFPRTDVAVIVLVTTGDSCFLARQAEWPAGHFATIAGFLEPGESLEDSVAHAVESGAITLPPRVSISYRLIQDWYGSGAAGGALSPGRPQSW